MKMTREEAQDRLADILSQHFAEIEAGGRPTPPKLSGDELFMVFGAAMGMLLGALQNIAVEYETTVPDLIEKFRQFGRQ